MSDEQHVVEQRNLFKINGKFSGKVYSFDIFKEIWGKTELKNIKATTAFNKISSVNYGLFKDGRATENNLITPGGFKLPVKNIKFSGDRIEINFKKIRTKTEEKRFFYFGLIWFENPERIRKDYCAYSKILKEESVLFSLLLFRPYLLPPLKYFL
jgi:hypothetical protein